MGLILWGQLQQAPVDLGKANQQPAHFEMIVRHAPDLGHQLLADIFGERFAVALGGEVITALGGVFVQRALEQVQGLGDLAHQLFLAEAERVALLAHKYTYIYAYFKA